MPNLQGAEKMVRTTITILLMVILFLGGVILGFDKAGEGMSRVRGDNSDKFDALQVSTDGDDYEVAVMGDSLNKKSLEDKKAEYRDISEDFFVEKIAKMIELSIKWLFTLIIESAYEIAELFYKA
jgi:Protein of unknown function (DUF3679)